MFFCRGRKRICRFAALTGSAQLVHRLFFFFMNIDVDRHILNWSTAGIFGTAPNVPSCNDVVSLHSALLRFSSSVQWWNFVVFLDCFEAILFTCQWSEQVRRNLYILFVGCMFPLGIINRTWIYKPAQQITYLPSLLDFSGDSRILIISYVSTVGRKISLKSKFLCVIWPHWQKSNAIRSRLFENPSLGSGG